ncbi:MAG: hypothetical protein ACFFER_16785 [Candidatus Thorarchaeota archaeon]
MKKEVSKKDPIYSRPAGKVKKIYPIEIKDEIDSKTVAIILNAAEASKLAVALINAVQMVTSKSKDIYITIWLEKQNYTVTVKGPAS